MLNRTTQATAVKQNFLSKFANSIENETFVRMSFAKPKGELKKILVRTVILKRTRNFQFVYRYPTKDITKNYNERETIDEIGRLLGKDFYGALLIGTDFEIEIDFNSKGEPRLSTRKSSGQNLANSETSHDKPKSKMIDPSSPYLYELWLVNAQGAIAKGKEKKFRQICVFLEQFDALYREAELDQKQSVRLIDMGSGMGYLTFALYEYLTRPNNKEKTEKQITVIGLEARKELVDACNSISKKIGFSGLSFQEGRIWEIHTEPFDILVALHACDTATDDALFQAIASKAKIILSVPCCHKEIRSQLSCQNDWAEALGYGIVKERQAELVTDGIRALLLESQGYRTNVSEFISAEHTAKNVLITGVWKWENPKKRQVLKKLANIKEFFGIKHQKLENSLEKAGSVN